jgi:hypothetical protein
MVSGSLLYLCSRKPSFLTFALGFVGYWGLQLNKLKKNDASAISSNTNDILQLLGSFLNSAARQNDDDIDTGDVAVCLLTFRAWLWTTRVTTEAAKAVQDLTFMLILSKLPFNTSFWDDVVVPALEGHIDPTMTQKVAKKALNTAGKTKELVEWIAMSSTMVSALLGCMEEFVVPVGDQEAAGSANEDTATTANAVNSADGDVNVKGADGSGKKGNKKKTGEAKGKKIKGAKSTTGVSLASQSKIVKKDDGEEEDGENEEGEDDADYGGMLDFTIDTKGDASVLDSLAAEKEKTAAKGKQGKGEKEGANGRSKRSESFIEDDVEDDVEDVDEMERELLAVTREASVGCASVNLETRQSNAGGAKKRKSSGKSSTNIRDYNEVDGDEEEVEATSATTTGNKPAFKTLAKKSDKKKARGRA